MVAARREAKRRRFIRHVLLVIFGTVLALVLMDSWLPQAPGADLDFSFHRQPDEGKHTPWYTCVENVSPAPARLRLSDLYRAAAGNVALYDPGKLANVMRHKPRAKALRILGIAGAAASVVIPLAGVKEVGLNLIGPALSGGTAIAVPAIEANQQFEVGIEGYWTTDQLLDVGEARCARVMTARSKDTLATFSYETRDVRAEMFHEAQQESAEVVRPSIVSKPVRDGFIPSGGEHIDPMFVLSDHMEPSHEPPVISSLKVEHTGAYTLPGDCPSCQTDTAMSDGCRPSAVVEEDGVMPCPWVD
jgi:hypothetical protein